MNITTSSMEGVLTSSALSSTMSGGIRLGTQDVGEGT